MTLREKRKAIGWTQKKLSDHIGVDLRTVRRWESGEIETPKYAELIMNYTIKYGEIK